MTTGTWIEGDLDDSTQCVHGAVKPDEGSGAIITPIYQCTTFVQPSVDKYLSKSFSYTRSSNPTVEILEQKIALLEGINEEYMKKNHDPENNHDTHFTPQNSGVTCFGAGMAATASVLSGFLKTGDHCIMTDCSYGGTNRIARVHYSKYGIHFEFVDFSDVENIRKAIKSNTKMIFSESPSNPVLTLADIEEISYICKMNNEKNAKNNKILHVCDSTFATPVLMKPILMGVDMVIHSTTKFLDGHNITVGGAVICRNKNLDEIVKFHRNMFGSIMTPQVAFYTLQTIKTLPLRIKQQSLSALKIAECLQKHPNVLTVSYPGLESFKQRKLAKKQHINDLQGGMICFEVKGGTGKGVKLMNTIKRPWSLCENLGACESIITSPSVFTHANMLREDRLKVGITDGLVRVSVGIEDTNDLIRALLCALDSL